MKILIAIAVVVIAIAVTKSIVNIVAETDFSIEEE